MGGGPTEGWVRFFMYVLFHASGQGPSQTPSPLPVIKLGGRAGISARSWEESQGEDTGKSALSWRGRIPTLRLASRGQLWPALVLPLAHLSASLYPQGGVCRDRDMFPPFFSPIILHFSFTFETPDDVSPRGPRSGARVEAESPLRFSAERKVCTCTRVQLRGSILLRIQSLSAGGPLTLACLTLSLVSNGKPGSQSVHTFRTRDLL